MLLSRRLWAVLLVGLLVVGLLVGFGDGDEAVAKEPRATLAKVMVSAAAFSPTTETWIHVNDGYRLRATGTGHFIAEVSFPVPEVQIRKITLVGYDNSSPGDVCVSLRRTQPLTANQRYLLSDSLCTVDSADDPQRVATTVINPRRINTANQALYMWVSMHYSTLAFYGIQVVYAH